MGAGGEAGSPNSAWGLNAYTPSSFLHVQVFVERSISFLNNLFQMKNHGRKLREYKVYISKLKWALS